MKKNIGGVERVIRIIAGAVILSLAFRGSCDSLGLSRDRTARNWPHRLVPGLYALRLLDLQELLVV